MFEETMDTPRLLIADDDKKTRDFVAAFLKYKGYDVVQACDGQDALDKLETEEVHLVITDLMMPRVNGLEFVKKLKTMRPGTVSLPTAPSATTKWPPTSSRQGSFSIWKSPSIWTSLKRT
ncbi:response regulator transcription factor [Geobacter metallireducens]|nr:response regulator [Geobacter metallireducens]